MREFLKVGDKNVINPQLVKREKIVFPPLHIKLGLIKQFVKVLDKNDDCFILLRAIFPNLSEKKLKAGIFDGPQIRKLINDSTFYQSMSSVEQNAWFSFVAVVQNFLGNNKANNFKELVEQMLTSFSILGCNMSIKVHFLFSHLEQFPVNLGKVSDEQGERFHQDIKLMEERYQGQWDDKMRTDYCWSIKRDRHETVQKRKSNKRRFTVMNKD